MTQRERSPGFDPAAVCAGELRVHVRYRPAEIDGGGDIYDVRETRFGTRVLIGDVMGAGVPASETAAGILQGWRAIVDTEPTLASVAVRLHGLITRSDHPERFVTALMMNLDCDPWTEFVCCGHPPPLLLRDGVASYVDMFSPSPPLGLLDMTDGWCSPGVFRFTGHDRLLLYTDGVSEARDDAGVFFPLAEQADAAARDHPDDDGLLDALMSGLRAHVGAAARDDVLMMTVGRGARSSPADRTRRPYRRPR
jgi:serine phosphatase RsbU (regulator of sigma subunit)